MKVLSCGFVISLGMLASGVQAETQLTVDGELYSLSSLMENCQSITGQPEAQIACFNAITQLLEDQSGGAETAGISPSQAFDELQAVAQYQDNDTGLSIFGAECDIQFVYYGNYFHISRRNVSTIDLFSAKFDASQFQLDQLVAVPGGQAPVYRGHMTDGVSATVHGGIALESTQHNFNPKSARLSLDAYATEVIPQLTANESDVFDFVLVHPAHSAASDDIVSAFENLVTACSR